MTSIPHWRPGGARWHRHALVAALLLVPALPSMAGDVDLISMFHNLSTVQTADGNVLANNGGFVSSAVFTLGGEIYGSGSVAFPGPSSPLSLSAASTTEYGFQSLNFASQAELDAAFPQGSYLYTLQGATAAVQVSFVLGTDAYALSQPYLDGSSFSSLQGMDAGQSKSLALSPFMVNSAAAASYIFFTVYDLTLAQFVFSENFLPADTAIELIPANSLQADHLFAYELTFSSRVSLATPGANRDTEVGYERRTSGQFSTAASVVPEPSTAWLGGAGLLGILGVARRRRPAPTCPASRPSARPAAP